MLKGGLLATVGSQNAEDIDVYGLAAFAALVGLFSKRALEKLREVFETLFSARRDYVDDEEKDEDNDEGEDQDKKEGGENGEEDGDGQEGGG